MVVVEDVVEDDCIVWEVVVEMVEGEGAVGVVAVLVVVVVAVLAVVVVVVLVVVVETSTKSAVIVPGPFISAVVDGEVASASDIEPVLVLHEENSYPFAGVATIWNEEPASCQDVPDGEAAPPALGDVPIDTSYCVANVIVSLVWDGTLIEPEEGDVTAYR
ncbi:MAG: hypothetical protein JRN12_07055, partial [Nitrososphaerota archaeon]|nr:hypothetical protein [Nitrososphaerota archaeon]